MILSVSYSSRLLPPTLSPGHKQQPTKCSVYLSSIVVRRRSLQRARGLYDSFIESRFCHVCEPVKCKSVQSQSSCADCSAQSETQWKRCCLTLQFVCVCVFIYVCVCVSDVWDHNALQEWHFSKVLPFANSLHHFVLLQLPLWCTHYLAEVCVCVCVWFRDETHTLTPSLLC